MKVHVTGWTDLKSDVEKDTTDCRERLLEGALVSIVVSEISASCDVSLISSEYIHGDLEFIYGEATSALDRALQLSLSVLKDGDSSCVDVILEGKFIHKSLEDSVVTFCCNIKLNVVTNGKELFDLDNNAKLNCGRCCKAKGTNLLNTVIDPNLKYAAQLSSFILFCKAVKWLSLISDIPAEMETNSVDEINLLREQCYNNLIYLHIAFENYEKAVVMASVTLERNPTNVKALYRRSVANTHLQNYELGHLDLQDIMKINPSNKDAQNQIKIIKDKQKIVDQHFAKIMKKFIFS